tara:strand:+ start:2620 stop:3507 length:888 start_codon:yes stop_codon:yes gene_type:complete
MKVISIFGGTGFIGTELVNQLAKMPIEIRVFIREKSQENQLKLLSRVRVFEYSSKKDLSDELEGSDVIINLVGILHESRKIKFSMAHEDFVSKLIKYALKKNIKRVIHLSALGVNKNAKSRYLYSKYKTELLIKTEFKDYNWTILRPSIVFGAQDKFINLFKIMIRFLPVIILVSPKAEFQPIYINDLVDIIIKSINDKKTFKKVFNLGGPKKLTFLEIIKLISFCDKKRNIVIGLNKTMSYLFVRLLQLLPIKIITTDNLKSMETSSTVNVNDAYSFKTSLKELSTYLINYKKN